MESLLWRLSVSVVPLLALIGSIYLIDTWHRRHKLHTLIARRRERVTSASRRQRRSL